MIALLKKINIPLLANLTKMFSFFDRRDKLKAIGLIFMMVFGASLELIGISLVLPFIQMILNPAILQSSQKFSLAYTFSGAKEPKQFFIYVGIALILVYFFKNTYSFLASRTLNRFLARKKLDFARALMNDYIRRPFTFHLIRSCQELLRNLSSTIQVVDFVWLPTMQILTELMVITGVFCLLLYVQPLATMGSIIFLGSFVLVFYSLVKKRISQWASDHWHHQFESHKWIQQSFYGIKEVKILGKEEFFLNSFLTHTEKAYKATQKSFTLAQLPRLSIEVAIVSGLIFFIIYLLMTGQDASRLLPTLALFAVSSFRLMPSINRIIAAAMQIREGSTVIDLVEKSTRELDPSPKKFVPRDAIPEFSFQNQIELKNISYQYANTKEEALHDISLTIPKGHSVAFVGQSGAGKTTIVDILLGLLSTKTGKVLVDGKDISENLEGWQKKIGYIPQQIFIADDTIKRNVAFGTKDDEIDERRVWKALEISQFDGFVRKMAQGLETYVGDRGVRLSGGQRQRIGIARALYANPEILVLDEATSALDNETERAFSEAIDRLQGVKTLIIIAHRLSTVTKCNKLFFMSEGRLTDSGTLDNLLKENQDFNRFANG